ncbi:MAG: cysteine hydrolase [Candidatus Komeilibacteria bacterium]|nr:cysteine hydrolase [Candidatus Komeilibacteria bacterium]
MKQALLIVDVQNFFINKWTQNIPKNIAGLINRENFPCIIFSQFINEPGSQFVKQLNFTGCAKPPYSDIVAKLKPWVKKDNIFAKCAFSVFANPNFEKYLKENKIEELTIVGLDTDYCVLSDCFNAFDRGFKVKVVENCCASFTNGPAGHQAALKIIKNNIGQII